MGSHEADAMQPHCVVVKVAVAAYLADMATYFQFQIDRCTQVVGRLAPDRC